MTNYSGKDRRTVAYSDVEQFVEACKKNTDVLFKELSSQIKVVTDIVLKFGQKLN